MCQSGGLKQKVVCLACVVLICMPFRKALIFQGEPHLATVLTTPYCFSLSLSLHCLSVCSLQGENFHFPFEQSRLIKSSEQLDREHFIGEGAKVHLEMT